jgi:hypothetical protein
MNALMRDFDFIEIGTSDFDTIVQGCPEDSVGLVIEPLGHYLDRLPDKPRVTKLRAAVAIDDVERLCTVYYVHPDDIVRHGLPDWLRGCNRIDGYHPQHIKHGIEELVRKEEAQQLPIGSILDLCVARRIKVLKIDTEGADCRILMSFFRHIKESGKGPEYLPRRILFENNGLTCPVELEQVLELTKRLGYIPGRQVGDELTLYKT